MFSIRKKIRLINLSILMTLIGISTLGIVSTASAATYLPYGGTWYDANKDWVGDVNLCWAGAASNILEWGGWDTPVFSDEHLIFDNFEDHWTDQGSLMHVAWQWWFDGTYPLGYPYGPTWATVDVAGGGNHYPALNLSDYFHEYWGYDTMQWIDTYLHSGYGVTLAIYDGGHAITCWGYEYDELDPDYYTGIYITDSDDGVSARQYYSLTKHPDGYWYFDNYFGYMDVWYLDGVQALERAPAVPEPATVLLVSSGLIGLGAFRRRLQKRKGQV